MKKIISILLAVAMAFSVFVVATFAASQSPTVHLSATCNLKGEIPKNQKESFKVSLSLVDGDAFNEVESILVNMNEIGNFAEIGYFEPDTFEYLMVQEKGENPNITYDDTRYLITVMVLVDEKDETGNTFRTVCSIENYDTGEKVDSADFENVYNTGSPETGDNSNLGLWIGLVALALLVSTLSFSLWFKKKPTVECCDKASERAMNNEEKKS